MIGNYSSHSSCPDNKEATAMETIALPRYTSLGDEAGDKAGLLNDSEYDSESSSSVGESRTSLALRPPDRAQWVRTIRTSIWHGVSNPRYLWPIVGLCLVLFLFPTGKRVVTVYQDRLTQDRQGPYIALREACRNNEWRPGLYVNCSLSMGLNNLRSEFATCLRYAYDAGAGLVLPGIALRNRTTLNSMAGKDVHFDHGRTDLYFDVDRLRDELSQWCPDLKLRDQLDTTNIAFQVKDKPRTWWELRFSAGDYRIHFDRLLHQNGISTWSATEGAIVEETHQPYATWNYLSHPADISHAWFDLIKWAPRLQRIADQVAAHADLQNGYLGIHLRLEKDALRVWHGYEKQMKTYEIYVNKRKERTIYLACGDPQWKPKVRARFPDHHVVDKWDLAAEGTDLRRDIEALSFDEMAVIDYVPMLKSSLVMGIGVSSFAYLLGVDRRANRTGIFADSLHAVDSDLMVGDKNTLLLPRILPEYFKFFP